MQNFQSVVKQQYSTVNKNNLNNSTVINTQDLRNFSDVIPDDGYYPFYLKKAQEIGRPRFIELVNRARAGSDTPARLFCWMLKNSELVR